jgi:hypothetical protein
VCVRERERERERENLYAYIYPQVDRYIDIYMYMLSKYPKCIQVDVYIFLYNIYIYTVHICLDIYSHI